MTDLVAFISSGKGTIAHVLRVIESENWDSVYILTTDEFSKEVPNKENIKKIILDPRKMLSDIIIDIKGSLKGIRIMDTAVNIISGEGKEHMALLSALLQLGVGIRFVALTKDGVKEI